MGHHPPAAVFFHSPDRNREQPERAICAAIQGFSKAMPIRDPTGQERPVSNDSTLIQQLSLVQHAKLWAIENRKLTFKTAAGSLLPQLLARLAIGRIIAPTRF
jgi:hypothetical protein